MIATEARLPFAALAVDRTLRLRLVTEGGAGFLGEPGGDGWTLRATGGAAARTLALSPDAAVVMSVHIDGRQAGEAVLDPGLPAPGEAPSLWQADPREARDPETLVPLSGRGVTRAAQVYALLPDGVAPTTEDAVTIGAPRPGPGGRVWPLSGAGIVRAGTDRLAVRTGAEADAPAARLVALGSCLGTFGLRDGTPVHLGQPRVLGSEGLAPLISLGRAAEFRPLRQVGAHAVEWKADDAVIARIRLVILPRDLRLVLREAGLDGLRLDATGVPPGWHLRLSAGEAVASAAAEPSGALEIRLPGQVVRGMVQLRMTAPDGQDPLYLEAPWPGDNAVVLDPAGTILTKQRDLSVDRLNGWRGVLPAAQGAVQLSLVGHAARIGFPAAGQVRLSIHAPLIRQALALGDPDTRVQLVLVGQGNETRRLMVGRSDWVSGDEGTFRAVGDGVTRLRAVCLGAEGKDRDLDAEGRVDLTGWLGDVPGLWYVQGRHVDRGVMRPFAWSSAPMQRSTRDARAAGFARMWLRLLDAPADPDWQGQTDLLARVRAAGEAGGLDQAFALGLVPAAAAALVFRARADDRATALAVETEAPLWWPLVTCADWRAAAVHMHRHLTERLQAAGLDSGDASRHLAAIAADIAVRRPELTAHLGPAVAAAGVPLALLRDLAAGALHPVPAPAARGHLAVLAQEAARRFDRLPQGTGTLRARRLSLPALSDAVTAFLQAPQVAAEVAAGLQPRPTASATLQLIALRAADPLWFDEALPAALTLAAEIAR